MQSKDFSLTSFRTLNNSKFKKGVLDLLSFLPNEDVYSIAQTASIKKVIPENIQEAIDIILIYTPDLDRFFSYRRITSKLLTQYLNVNNVILKGYATNQHLISSIRELWASKFCDREKEEPDINDSTSKENNLGTTLKLYIKSDEFAHSFAGWFFERLNNINNESAGCERLDASMFCSNASSNIYILYNSQLVEEYNSESDEECEQLFSKVISKYKVTFLPNLDNGTQAVKSLYGPIRVLSCGTIFKGKECIGVFEEEFGLVQNPNDKNWKIFFTKINLKTAVQPPVTPSLPPCPVFDIECV
ncbi:UNVERIFIED_CONTAM: hypothetical protein RMT77_019248 [Armadillidium vulgare]